MGGGGAPKNTTTTTETKIPDWLSKDYQSFLGQAQTANDKPYQSYQGQLNAGLSSGQQQALQNAQQGAVGSPYQTNALNGVLGGQYNVQAGQNPYQGATTYVPANDYTGSNPYLQSMIDKSNGDITSQFQKAQGNLASQFSSGGAFGGSAMQQAVTDQNKTLADGLTNNENQYRFQDYTTQQQLNESAINRLVQAQQTDLARNSALSQQGFQNQLSAQGQNAQNILGASQSLNGVNALQSQYNGQLSGLGQVQQDYAQGNIDQAYNDWYQQNYGYDQQKLNNYGNALNAASGNFVGSAVSGANPAYKPRTVGGAATSALGGAATGAALGSVVPGIGTAIGAVAGGVMGAAGYYL